jgi:hypothetical protein
VAPFPKAQDHEVGEPVEESVNWTDWLVVGKVGEKVKEAVGGGKAARETFHAPRP